MAINAAIGSALEGREMQRFRDGKQQGHVKTESKSTAQLVCALSPLLTAGAGKQAALCPRWVACPSLKGGSWCGEMKKGSK